MSGRTSPAQLRKRARNSPAKGERSKPISAPRTRSLRLSSSASRGRKTILSSGSPTPRKCQIEARGEPGKDGALGERGADGAIGERGREGPQGRDGRDGLPGVQGERGKDGRDGADGLGFDNARGFEDQENFGIEFLRGDEVIRRFTFKRSTIADQHCGPYKSGEAYKRGRMATYGGSTFVCLKDTSEKPEGPDWLLIVKHGLPGRNGKDGERGPPGPTGRDGRDLTQLGRDGVKYA